MARGPLGEPMGLFGSDANCAGAARWNCTNPAVDRVAATRHLLRAAAPPEFLLTDRRPVQMSLPFVS